MSRVPTKCCRSLPRCASCPVVLARRRADASRTQELVAQILLGAPSAPLPAAVAQQLDELAAARRPITGDRGRQGAARLNARPLLGAEDAPSSRSSASAAS